MPVAPSYQKFAFVGEPFSTNNKMYVTLSNGRTVRWYTDAQYQKLYPSSTAIASTATTTTRSKKDVLGFSLGYVTIFKGDTYAHLEWFQRSAARYNRIWGWFFPSEIELPPDLPIELTPVQLRWESISKNGSDLNSDSEIEATAQSLLFEASNSTHVGSIGDRIELSLKVTKAIPLETRFGTSILHTLTDENSNTFTWNTSAKNLPVGGRYVMRGTIKSHDVYKNEKQTALTRCVVVEELQNDD